MNNLIKDSFYTLKDYVGSCDACNASVTRETGNYIFLGETEDGYYFKPCESFFCPGCHQQFQALRLYKGGLNVSEEFKVLEPVVTKDTFLKK